jgi:hypothetical protein
MRLCSCLRLKAQRAKIQLAIDDQVIGTVQPAPDTFTQTFRVPASVHKNATSTLKLTAEATTVLPNGARNFAFSASSIVWNPAAEKK